MLETIRIDCPYCGEGFDTEADCSAGDQAYIEDCAVCCQPIEIALSVDHEGNLLSVRAQRNDE